MQQSKIETKRKNEAEYGAYSPLSDLIQGCILENRMAQKHLYMRFYSQLFGTALRYTRNREEAQEVLNNAFLKIFGSIKTFQTAGSFGAWINKIVIYTSIDYLRKYAKFKDTAPLEYAANITLPNHTIEQMSADEIYELLSALSPTTRAVFSMYAIDGFKHKEIAKILNFSPNTSKWYFAKAKKELQQLIIEQEKN